MFLVSIQEKKGIDKKIIKLGETGRYLTHISKKKYKSENIRTARFGSIFLLDWIDETHVKLYIPIDQGMMLRDPVKGDTDIWIWDPNKKILSSGDVSFENIEFINPVSSD